MNEILQKISEIGIVPVIKIDDPQKAVPLAKALYDGGIPCAEVTFRTAHAAEAISLINEALPDMLLGAGTVTTTEQIDRAIAAGAKFMVSPGLNPSIVAYSLKKGVPFTPGCSTPSDIERAMELGLDVVKFFPAEAAGGLKAIKAMAAPYTSMKFMPTGGVNAKNINEYLAFPRILACGGSWMVDPALIEAGNFDEIRRLSDEAVRTVLGFELAHIGINAGNEGEAESVAKLFSLAFGFEYKPGNSSLFAGDYIEVMKTPYLGKNGHIAIRTNSIARAKRYLLSKGFACDESTLKTDASGKPVAIYLEKEFGGFAVHIVQKK